MSRPKHEVAEIIERFGKRFIEKHAPNTYQLGVLGALSVCRTPALGGHKYHCDHCGSEHTVYNSCKNRHCPKCQSTKQAFWVEDRNICFRLKDYRDQGKAKTITLTGEEFLRRFCQYILPKGFVKVRYYGICSTRFRNTVLKNKDKMVIKPKEATPDFFADFSKNFTEPSLQLPSQTLCNFHEYIFCPGFSSTGASCMGSRRVP